MYSDLAYFAYGRGGLAEKVGTYVREHGLAGVAAAVDPAVAAANIAAKEAWLAANPLPANAPEETRQERALLVAALAAAKSRTATEAERAAALQTFAAAQARYQQFAAATSKAETPSPLALWLSGMGLDLSGAIGKVLLIGGVGLAAYLLLPLLLRGGTSRRSSW